MTYVEANLVMKKPSVRKAKVTTLLPAAKSAKTENLKCRFSTAIPTTEAKESKGEASESDDNSPTLGL